MYIPIYIYPNNLKNKKVLKKYCILFGKEFFEILRIGVSTGSTKDIRILF